MSQNRFIRSTENRALDEELDRLRKLREGGGTDTSALTAALTAALTELQSIRIQIAQLKEGAVVVREIGSATEELTAYLETNPDHFSLLGTGNLRQLHLGIGTTQGDLIVWDDTPEPVRLPVGADGEVLTANSAVPEGVEWAAAGGGSGDLRGVRFFSALQEGQIYNHAGTTASSYDITSDAANWRGRGINLPGGATDDNSIVFLWQAPPNMHATPNLTCKLITYTPDLAGGLSDKVIYLQTYLTTVAHGTQLTAGSEGAANALSLTHSWTQDNLLHITAVTLSDVDSLAAGRFVWVRVRRNSADANDTSSGDVILMGVELYWDEA
jgi:hypothetical protein